MTTLKTSMTVIWVLLSLTFLMSCSRSSEQKVADARANVVAAKEDVKDAATDAQRAEAREEWVKFKTAAEDRIAANDKIVADYRTKMTNSSGKLRAKYNKEIDALETKNKALRAKLNGYQDSGKNAWEQFTREFNHDMDELGKALKDFSVDNKK